MSVPIERESATLQDTRAGDPNLPVGKQSGGDRELASPPHIRSQSPQAENRRHYGRRREQSAQRECEFLILNLIPLNLAAPAKPDSYDHDSSNFTIFDTLKIPVSLTP